MNGTLDNLVAVWESVYALGVAAQEYFISFDDIRYNDSQYFSLIGMTSFNLTKAGWYRFTLTFLWSELDCGEVYWLYLEKNGGLYQTVYRTVYLADTYLSVNVVCYAMSSGNDVFRFKCESNTLSFNIYSSQVYNQMVIEYISELQT